MIQIISLVRVQIMQCALVINPNLMKNFLITKAALIKAINLPIIASSGFRDLADIKNVFSKTDVSAIAIGSSLHNGRININKIKKMLQD